MGSKRLAKLTEKKREELLSPSPDTTFSLFYKGSGWAYKVDSVGGTYSEPTFANRLIFEHTQAAPIQRAFREIQTHAPDLAKNLCLYAIQKGKETSATLVCTAADEMFVVGQHPEIRRLRRALAARDKDRWFFDSSGIIRCSYCRLPEMDGCDITCPTRAYPIISKENT